MATSSVVLQVRLERQSLLMPSVYDVLSVPEVPEHVQSRPNVDPFPFFFLSFALDSRVRSYTA